MEQELTKMFVNVAEVARLTGLCLKTTKRRVQDGTIKSVRIGRRILVPVAELERLARGGV